MTALAARLRPRWEAAAARVVDAAGRAVGAVGRGLPGVTGPLLICYGLYDVYAPLGYLGAGAFLLILDRRIP